MSATKLLFWLQALNLANYLFASDNLTVDFALATPGELTVLILSPELEWSPIISTSVY